MNINPKTGREGEEGGEQSKQNSKADWAKAPGLALEKPPSDLPHHIRVTTASMWF